MNVQTIHPAESQNLLNTYRELALSVPGSTAYLEAGFEAVTATIDHPICNYAAGLDLDPWSARRLIELAQPHPSFHVYVLPGDQPGHIDELLTRSGFRSSQMLVQMTASPDISDSDETLEMVQSVGANARFATAAFMADQFFYHQSGSFRTRVAEATAETRSLELFCRHESGQIQAAVMLSLDSGILGVYNVCVHPSARNRGLGSRLIRWCLHRGAVHGVPLTLQCESRLVEWYQGFGFVKSGSVRVYGLSKTQQTDIMTVI